MNSTAFTRNTFPGRLLLAIGGFAVLAALELRSANVTAYFLINTEVMNWISFFLATPIVLFAGQPMFETAWSAFHARTYGLISLFAAVAAISWFLGLIDIVFNVTVPALLLGPQTTSPYFTAATAAVVIGLLIQAGKSRNLARQPEGNQR